MSTAVNDNFTHEICVYTIDNYSLHDIISIQNNNYGEHYEDFGHLGEFRIY